MFEMFEKLRRGRVDYEARNKWIRETSKISRNQLRCEFLYAAGMMDKWKFEALRADNLGQEEALGVSIPDDWERMSELNVGLIRQLIEVNPGLLEGME